MVIHLKKGRDGPPTLACVRPDGSRTWGKLHPFFPLHDLTHCAVESVLGLDQAFFGLIASGWAIDDFATPGTSTRFPPQALLAEHVVGMLDRERAGGSQPASTFNAELVAAFPGGRDMPPLPLTEDALIEIRRVRDALEAQWHALLPGEVMEVHFPSPLATTT